MTERLLRIHSVREIVGLSRSSIYAMMSSGDFPRPLQIGPRAVAWRESDIRAWLDSRPRSRPQ
jgi:prophage regulatory protein